MAGEYPLGPRILAGVGGLVIAAWFAVLAPLSMLAQGYRWTALYLGVSSGLLALFLLAIAVAPGLLQRVLSRISRADLRDPGHVGALILLAGSIYYVFGYGLADGVYAIEGALTHAPTPDQPLDATAILVGLSVNVAVLVLPVVLYVSFVGDRGPVGAFRALGLKSEGAGRQILAGVLLAGGFIVALVALSALLTRLPVSVPENDRALAIAKSLSLGSALAVAVGAAVSEEVFFRGFLLARVGVFLQAILFSLAHLSYVNVLEIVVTFSLGLALGIMRRRTGSLWGPIAAHFAFDFLELLVGIYAPTST